MPNKTDETGRWTSAAFAVTSIEPDGTVNWPPGWTAARKREYLRESQQSVFDLYPENGWPTGGTFDLLEASIAEAEAAEAS